MSLLNPTAPITVYPPILYGTTRDTATGETARFTVRRTGTTITSRDGAHVHEMYEVQLPWPRAWYMTGHAGLTFDEVLPTWSAFTFRFTEDGTR